MTQLIEVLRATATKPRASNQEHPGGVVLVWEGVVYGWENELRDPESERPGAYAVDRPEWSSKQKVATTTTARKRGSLLTLTDDRKMRCEMHQMIR